MNSLQPSDYSVDVGSATCGIVSVTSSALFCMPPEEEPEKTANSPDDGHLVIASCIHDNKTGVRVEYYSICPSASLLFFLFY